MCGVGLPHSYGRVEREWKRFDLAFFAAPKPPDSQKERDAEIPVFVIENKFKSLPNEEQIKRYRKKLNDKSPSFYFLTLFDTDSKGVGHTTTPAVTYAGLVEAMDTNLHLITDPFIHELVERYIGFVSSLRDFIMPYVECDETRLGEMTIAEYFCRPEFDDKESKYKPVKDLQLYSPIMNVRMAFLCQLLRNRLYTAGLELGADSDRVNLSSGIASQKGLVECWINIGEPYDDIEDKAISMKPYLYRYFVQFDNGFINHGIQVNTPAGKQIQIAYKKEKSTLKRNLASSFDKINELKPLDSLIGELMLKADSNKTTGFNNMIYTCLHPEPILHLNVIEGLNMMADDIIKTYNKLYKQLNNSL